MSFCCSWDWAGRFFMCKLVSNAVTYSNVKPRVAPIEQEICLKFLFADMVGYQGTVAPEANVFVLFALDPPPPPHPNYVCTHVCVCVCGGGGGRHAQSNLIFYFSAPTPWGGGGGVLCNPLLKQTVRTVPWNQMDKTGFTEGHWLDMLKHFDVLCRLGIYGNYLLLSPSPSVILGRSVALSVVSCDPRGRNVM